MRLSAAIGTEPAEINDHRDQHPQKIDSRHRHMTVNFPRVYDRGERQKNKEYRQQQTTVECTLQVGRKNHINTSATRGNSRITNRRKQGTVDLQTGTCQSRAGAIIPDLGQYTLDRRLTKTAYRQLI